MITNVPSEKLLEAMEQFDEESRGTKEWSNWEQNGTHKYAIVHDGKRYPVKQIIRMATGEKNFSGGDEANSFVTKRGFSVASLQDDIGEDSTDMRHGFEKILSRYALARTNKEKRSNHELWSVLSQLAHSIEATDAVRARPDLKVKPSVGQDDLLSAVPTIVIRDTRETKTTQRGVYCVYLFREDMSGVYFTFGQGAKVFQERYGGRVSARPHIQARADELRRYCHDLPEHGFSLDIPDLHTHNLYGKDYEDSTIAHKLYATGSVPPDSVLVQDLEAILTAYDRYLEQETLTNGKVGKPSPGSKLLGELVETTNLTQSEVEKIEELLREKKQIIFEGPPGAGKTYVAELFARYFTDNQLEGPHDERIVVVQFHQSYGYEDFVQGIRPETNAKGQLEYRVRDGVFKRLCDTAGRNPNENFVIVVDEINRGNISRIFGELLFLLEYRDKRVSLPYSRPNDPPFSIPKNVYMIGTMNTTDRSLAQIDYALRRRFFFYRMLPVIDGAAPVLKRWLEKQEFGQESQEQVLRLFVALNERIRLHLGEHYQVGHSYFMTPDIATEAGRDRVWMYAVMPLLEEYFYNYRDRETILSEFAIDNLFSDQG